MSLIYNNIDIIIITYPKTNLHFDLKTIFVTFFTSFNADADQNELLNE